MTPRTSPTDIDPPDYGPSNETLDILEADGLWEWFCDSCAELLHRLINRNPLG